MGSGKNQILILKGNIVFTEESSRFTVFENSYLISEGNYIVGTFKKLPEEYKNIEVKDYGDKLIIPGFVDLHVHAPQYSLCGLGYDKTLLEWLNNYTFKEEANIPENKYRINKLFKESVGKTVACLLKYKDYNWRISDSTGKDSLVSAVIFLKARSILKDKKGINSSFDVDFFNTSNDTADTYKTMKKHMMYFSEVQLEDSYEKDINTFYKNNYNKWVHNPKVGWYQWLKNDKNYYLPTVMVRNCGSTYKEGQLKKVLNKKDNNLLILGMRKYESSRRADYDWYLNDAMNKMWNKTHKNKYKLNVPENWVIFLPCVNWKDEDVWMFILQNEDNIKLELNPMYKKGFGRVGCLICPFGSDYNDLLIQYWYKKLWDNFYNIAKKNYEIYNVKRSLKWTEEEYITDGNWKNGISKLYQYITKKPTPERVKAVSEILGVSEEIALKYFKRKCDCGKKLNPDEVAMNLKLFGRYEGQEDNRTFLCKKCMCKKLNISSEEYSNMVIGFKESGCNLFEEVNNEY